MRLTRRLVAAILAVAALAVLVGATTTAGATPAPTTDIVLLRDTTTDDWLPAGWTVPAGLSGRPAEGMWIDHGKHWGGGQHTETLQESTTQVAAGDSSFDIHWTATWNANVEIQRCEIINGTGVYTGIHGTGSWTLDFDSVPDRLLITCAARVRFDNRR